MSYNFLKDARIIKNSLLCRYDNLDSYSSIFQINGDVDGWDIYNNIYLYGCWNGVLFGTAYDRNCYISRTNPFAAVAAENYYYIKIMLQVVSNNENKPEPYLTKGRIQWTTLADDVWDSNKQIDFDLIVDTKWHLYTINMGPEQNWQGNINNFRFYPFIDGWKGDKFNIQFIKISSRDIYSCSNTQCSYYLNYEHNCLGAGNKSSCETGIAKTLYTTISGISDELIIDIDNYGEETFYLGNNVNTTGIEMSKIIQKQISGLNIGKYSFSNVEYTGNNKLKILSGSFNDGSTVIIKDTQAARVLGFYDDEGNDISIYKTGSSQATGFDYSASRLLTTFEINKLIDGDKEKFAYIHNPNQYNVEGGRRDFQEVGIGDLIATSAGEKYESIDNREKTLIDFSHPINSNGKIKAIYVYCNKPHGLAKVKICRPHKNGQLTVVHSIDFPIEESNIVYTTKPTVYKLDCNILVDKGDIIGIYNADVLVGISIVGNPDAVFTQIDGEVNNRFNPGKIQSYGIAGFAIYAKSDRYQTNVILDIDLGKRINIEEINVYGKETTDYFEFNIASCLDVNWAVNLFGGKHDHTGFYKTTSYGWHEEHLNKYYGRDCLDDQIKTADNGKQGNSSGVDSESGLWTSGPHAYFYVNGDAEWLYSLECNDTADYCGGKLALTTSNFTYDPIEFILLFPYGFSCEVFKSIIYFKEKNNFRNIELSHYLGSSNFTGNATRSFSYRRVSKYTGIRLDGIWYDDSNNEDVKEYIFKNPTNERAIYGGPDGAISNAAEIRQANFTKWVILEHNFDPINCYGFRVYTDHHNSTKITEMELYSKITTDPSLTDNIVVSFSTYGDLWNMTDFDSENSIENKITSFIGGSPRYLKLELESQSEFELNEIELLTGDQVKLETCDDNILLEDAKTGIVNNSVPVVLENIYGKPLDLSVDIPKETYETTDMIFWSKLGSQDEIDKPEVGPGCVLYKNDNFDIRNNNAQCAINCPCYALKNLVHGKEAYYKEKELDWVSYGTLSSGVSVDYCNEDYISAKKSIFTFSAVSSKYWKIYFDDVSDYAEIKDIMVYYDDVEVEIEKIHMVSNPGIKSQAQEFASDGLDIEDITVTLNDSFTGINGSDPSTGLWTKTESTSGTVKIWNNELAIDIASSGSTEHSTIESSYRLIGDFDIQVDFNDLNTGTANNNGGYLKIFLDDGSVNYYFIRAEYTVGLNIFAMYFNYHGYNRGYTVSRVNNYGKLRLTRIDGVITSYYQDGSGDWTVLYPATYPYFTSDYHVIIGMEHHSGGGSVSCDFDNFKINSANRITTIFDNSSFGFKLNSSEPINKIKLFHTDSTLNSISIYTSSDNTDNYLLHSAANIVTTNENNYIYFVIDLEKRHNLDIIRNYGNITNKMWLSTSVGVDFSNSNTSNINSVIWNNSIYEDVRWLRILILCGDGTTRCLRKLGIYPEITQTLCIDGGYNCEWEDLGTIFTDYTVSKNVAYGAVVTGTNNYFSNCYPDKAVDGISDKFLLSECWGFEKKDDIDPYIEMDFGQTYLINKIVLYHGYHNSDDSYMNTAYTLSVSTTTSGENFTNILTATNSTKKFEITHQFDPAYARRARFTITNYDSGRLIYFDEITKNYEEFKGSFLREIEIYNYVDTGYVDSETWPIICIDLQDQYNIANHGLINKDITDSDTNWNNDEVFFKYSDNVLNDPKKISFNRSGDYITIYYSDNSSGDRQGTLEYTFVENKYIEAGIYNISWESYYANVDNEVSLRLDGNIIVDHFADNLSASWVGQIGVIDVPESGFYSIKAIQHIDIENKWGARKPHIYKSHGYTKWLAVIRDTAENYSYGDDSDLYGKDYLSLVKVYGDIKYIPTEYPWWWNSVISTLESDYLTVKNNRRSLKIIYPTSSGIDEISFIEGDVFGIDTVWSPKDFLTFWWYIDNVNNLDTNFGDITFGIINGSEPIYYKWQLNRLNLVSGWNKVRLKFEDYDSTYPIIGVYTIEDFLDKSLDFRINGEDWQSFRVRYRGKNENLIMNIESLKIERNIFDEDVKFGKGLCLTGFEYLDIPLSNITMEKGTIEFYLKMYCDTYGRDLFSNMESKTFFTIVNNNNNLISLGIKSGTWFGVNYGHVRKQLIGVGTDQPALQLGSFYRIGDIVHFAVTWDNKGLSMDNNDTLRFYINNELVFSSTTIWEVEDTKSINIHLGGSNTQLAYNQDSYGSSVFDNIKIYNYCKTNFDINIEGSITDRIFTPNEFMEISSDNINFYGNNSENLPLLFKEVPANQKKTIFVRTIKDANFKQAKRKTGSLIVEWLTTV